MALCLRGRKHLQKTQLALESHSLTVTALCVPMSANDYLGQAVTLQDWHWVVGLLKKITVILLWRRDFSPRSGKWCVRLLKYRCDCFVPICTLCLLCVYFQWSSLVSQHQHDVANGNLSKILNIRVLPHMYSLSVKKKVVYVKAFGAASSNTAFGYINMKQKDLPCHCSYYSVVA